jgi:hypothetical protein
MRWVFLGVIGVLACGCAKKIDPLAFESKLRSAAPGWTVTCVFVRPANDQVAVELEQPLEKWYLCVRTDLSAVVSVSPLRGRRGKEAPVIFKYDQDGFVKMKSRWTDVTAPPVNYLSPEDTREYMARANHLAHAGREAMRAAR